MRMIQVTFVSLFLFAYIMSIGALTRYDRPWIEECSSGKMVIMYYISPVGP